MTMDTLFMAYFFANSALENSYAIIHHSIIKFSQALTTSIDHCNHLLFCSYHSLQSKPALKANLIRCISLLENGLSVDLYDFRFMYASNTSLYRIFYRHLFYLAPCTEFCVLIVVHTTVFAMPSVSIIRFHLVFHLFQLI